MSYITDGPPILATDIEKGYLQRTGTFGGDGSDGNFVSSGGEIITGVKNYQNFTIGIGFTVTVGDATTPWAIIKCTGNVSIAGTLTASAVCAFNDDEPTVAVVMGVGVIGSAPFLNSSGNQTGGASLARNGGPYDVPFAGNKTAGFRIIKIMRGWYCGSMSPYQPLSGHMGLGGGAILIECLGTVTISGTVSANGGDDMPSGGGGAGIIGILSVGNLNGSGSTVTANGGNIGIGNTGGAGAILLVSQGVYTSPSTLTVSGGGETGEIYATGSATAAFCQKGWALGD